FELTSTAFRQGEAVPREYTADGRNAPPPLRWTEPPAGTRGFALVCEDPDAPRGTFTHWILFNGPQKLRALTGGASQEAALPKGAAQGRNDFGKVGYGGPSPPPGKPHRYFFKLHALDRLLDLEPGTTKDQFFAALKGHVLGEAQLMGTYARTK